MPLYSYKDEEGNELTIKASWNDVKAQDSNSDVELEKFLKQMEQDGNLMSGKIVPGIKYKRVMCSPALKFKGSGFHVNDYAK